jgi:tagatose 6-phosphate kinase
MEEIIVISLSPAVDRNYKVTQLHPGQMHRAGNPVISPGGKGINVARVLSLLGAKVKLLGFFAGANGKFIIDDLEKNGICVEAIMLDGETRNSINIIDSKSKKETEILETGPSVEGSGIENLYARFLELLENKKSKALVVFSGGIPQGADNDIYAKLILMAKKHGALCFLDTSQQAFIDGIGAVPFFIKPNLRELSQLLPDEDFSSIIKNLREGTWTRGDLLQIREDVRQFGIPRIAITLSDKGALLCFEDRLLFAGPIDINPVNTIGSGDSFTAGFAYAVATGMPDEDCLRMAVACSASNALFEEIGVINPQMVQNFIKEVRIEEIF